jgi:uncharacterized protein (TIGR02452 family)
MANSASASQKTNTSQASLLWNLSKDQRTYIAADTLKKVNAGYYQSYDGCVISLREDVTFCMLNSVLYTEEDLNSPNKVLITKDETNSDTLNTATVSKLYPTIEVRHCTTLQAAQSLVTEHGEDCVGVLNFASAKNPGGGFQRGANAQEESLARSSILHSALIHPRVFDGFYGYNRCGKRGIYSDRMIYSPRVSIFKACRITMMNSIIFFTLLCIRRMIMGVYFPHPIVLVS